MIITQTERLIIRSLALADASFIYDLVNQPSWLEHIGDKGVRSLQDAETYIQLVANSYQKNGFGLCRIEITSSSEAIGICGLVKRDSLQNFDIGFALLSEYEGNGYALESASAILQIAKEEYKLRRIAAICTPNNHSSIKLLEKLGFQLDPSTSPDSNGKPLRLFTVTLSQLDIEPNLINQ